MRCGLTAIARACAVLTTAMLATGCVSFRPLEPVAAPPGAYQGDTLVPVEFVNPATIGLRCAERGTKFMMLPGINSNACASPDLITMPNPCLTLTGGGFAGALCSAIARANYAFEKSRASAPVEDTLLIRASLQTSEALDVSPARYQGKITVPVEFVVPEKVSMRCAERGAKIAGEGDLARCADADLITMPNPCDLEGSGWYAETMCHEMAHANGWAANHKHSHWDAVLKMPRALAPAALLVTQIDVAPQASKLAETASAVLAAAPVPAKRGRAPVHAPVKTAALAERAQPRDVAFQVASIGALAMFR